MSFDVNKYLSELDIEDLKETIQDANRILDIKMSNKELKTMYYLDVVISDEEYNIEEIQVYQDPVSGYFISVEGMHYAPGAIFPTKKEALDSAIEYVKDRIAEDSLMIKLATKQLNLQLYKLEKLESKSYNLEYKTPLQKLDSSEAELKKENGKYKVV